MRTLASRSLFATHFLLPLAAFAVSSATPDDWPAHNVFDIVVFGEAGILCVWAGLGARPWQQRLVLTLAGLTACWILLWFREKGETPERLVRCLLFPGAASVVLAVAIKSTRAYLVGADGTEAKSAWQFTVGQLLVFTSTVAVIIVLVQHSLEGNIVVNRRMVMAEGVQISVVILVWAAIGGRLRKARIALASVMACAVGLTVQSFRSDSWFWGVLEDLPYVPWARLWEDLLSIPAAVLLEGLLAAATVIAMQPAADGTRSPEALD
ncbi:MAG TPA: hypothetical protein VG826_33355 [Pirellulales bacterium]|nr:hypothetical protein [Pirellulales bacterium]